MNAIRVRKFGGVASVIVGGLVAGAAVIRSDALSGAAGVLCLLIGIATLYDLHAAA